MMNVLFNIYLWLLRIVASYFLFFWTVSIVGFVFDAELGNQTDYGFFLYSITVVIPLIVLYIVTLRHLRKKHARKYKADRLILYGLLCAELILGVMTLSS